MLNGLGCSGRQAITGEDLYEVDTQTGFIAGMDFVASPPYRNKKGKKSKTRDIIRKAAFGMNFAVIGIENQEGTDYEIPLRNLSYDAGEYEKQAARIRKETRKIGTDLTAGEYLYGFRKDSKLCPVLTFILYTGANPWDGPRSMHDKCLILFGMRKTELL